ncbi:hypothetical protein D3C71_374170 [compost metagenome]
MNRLFILFALFVTASFGQENKLEKFLGLDFQFLSVRKDIPYMETAPGCEIIPSLTLQGDTSGLVYQNEYLLFRNYEESQKGVAAYVKTTFVSNEEYMKFQEWVRDSIAREKIIGFSNRIEPVLKFMKYSEKELEEGDEIDRSRKMYALRYEHALNWKTKFTYNDPQWMPLIADMYLPQPERFYKFRDFDKRKLEYRYFQGPDQIDFHTIILNNMAFWANESHSTNDEYAVLGQAYEQLFPTDPLIGLTGMQAHAFCHWKEMQLQNELDKKHLSYKVRVTLPLMSELVKTHTDLTVPAKDYTGQWRITVENYQSFMLAVKDSILMEHLFYQLQDGKETRADALKLVPYKESYFNEGEQEFKKLDLSDYEMIRYLYPLKKDSGIFKKYKEKVREIETEQEGHLNVYIYYRMDVRSKAVIGKLRTNEWGLGYNPPVLFLETYEIDSATNNLVGMDLNLDYVNKLGQGNGARSHENYSRFILKEYCTITPSAPIENQNPEDLVKGITYEQAMAYYHWKYPIWKAKSGDDWQNYVYPSKEQFERIQHSEQIIVPEHQINYPTPVFRYVVTFIPN